VGPCGEFDAERVASTSGIVITVEEEWKLVQSQVPESGPAAPGEIAGELYEAHNTIGGLLNVMRTRINVDLLWRFFYCVTI